MSFENSSSVKARRTRFNSKTVILGISRIGLCAIPASRAAREWGMLLLVIWLIAMGALPLLAIHSAAEGTILSILAIAAGIFLLLDR